MINHDFCATTCGRCPCNGAPVLDLPAPACPAACTDTPPYASIFTCAQQQKFGACGEPWMQGFCRYSCGECACPKEGEGGISGGAFRAPSRDKKEDKEKKEKKEKKEDKEKQEKQEKQEGPSPPPRPDPIEAPPPVAEGVDPVKPPRPYRPRPLPWPRGPPNVAPAPEAEREAPAPAVERQD